MKQKILLKNFQVIQEALFHAKEKILFLSDLHLGYEDALIKQGILLPKNNFESIKAKLQQIFLQTGFLEKVIINGDLKHEFKQISEQEWSEVKKIISLISENSKEIILIKGNHDNILGPIANYANLQVVDFYFNEKLSLFACHGNKILKSKELDKAKIILIGHEHPSISLSDQIKRENFKAFLKGKWKSKILIVQPSFFTLTQGSDLLKEKTLSPFLKSNSIKSNSQKSNLAKSNLPDFEAWLIEENKLFYFGKIKDLLLN